MLFIAGILEEHIIAQPLGEMGKKSVCALKIHSRDTGKIVPLIRSGAKWRV
jgi:hypothetical protein